MLLHPGLLAALVRDMEADSTLFMATGVGFCMMSTIHSHAHWLVRGQRARECGGNWAGNVIYACVMPAHPPPLVPTTSLRPLFLPGYPFDVPAEGAGLLSYCALSYHLPLVVPFSVKERTEFVWGGCMLFRAAEMRGDARGILRVSDGWAGGGAWGQACWQVGWVQWVQLCGLLPPPNTLSGFTLVLLHFSGLGGRRLLR